MTPLASLANLSELWIGPFDGRNSFSDLGPLSNLVRLRSIALNYSEVNDLSPLASLPELHSLELEFAKVTSVAPLLSFPITDPPLSVSLVHNPIDCEGEAANLATLSERGMIIGSSCP